ncbi:hypothetical protein [Timonella senegalensis]|uniref:hypothetical protein n=1 Tax=Timonella senegalensis TaxID=1465825 RepID=UPI0028ADC11A|nr:hypothetical protein [Timonella senegalensis]
MTSAHIGGGGAQSAAYIGGGGAQSAAYIGREQLRRAHPTQRTKKLTTIGAGAQAESSRISGWWEDKQHDAPPR